MALEEAPLYYGLFVFCLSFTILAVWRKTVIPTAFSFVSWLLMGIVHLGSAPKDIALQVAPAVLYFSLGLVFLVVTVQRVLEAIEAGLKNKEQRVDAF